MANRKSIYLPLITWIQILNQKGEPGCPPSKRSKSRAALRGRKLLLHSIAQQAPSDKKRKRIWGVKFDNKIINLANNMKVRDKHSHQWKEKKQEGTSAEVQLQVGVRREHERGGGVIGSLSGCCLGSCMSGNSQLYRTQHLVVIQGELLLNSKWGEQQKKTGQESYSEKIKTGISVQVTVVLTMLAA